MPGTPEQKARQNIDDALVAAGREARAQQIRAAKKPPAVRRGRKAGVKL
jgi:hypothetical protein